MSSSTDEARQTSRNATLPAPVAEQLRRDLNDLPELCDHMHANYWHLVARGSADTADPRHRTVIDPAPVDLHDRRPKEFADDPIGETDLARRIGAQRAGILPVLAAWVELIADQAAGYGIRITDPAHPHTITTAAGWLARHLDYIGTRTYAPLLADQIRHMTHELEQMVGPAYAAPDEDTVATGTTIADLLGVDPATIRQWVSRGLLHPALDPTTGQPQRHNRQRLYFVNEARAVHRSTRRRRP